MLWFENQYNHYHHEYVHWPVEVVTKSQNEELTDSHGWRSFRLPDLCLEVSQRSNETFFESNQRLILYIYEMSLKYILQKYIYNI